METLDKAFYPRGIAVVGASKDANKLSNKWVKGPTTAGFPGELYPVNPNESGEIHGRKIYSRVSDIPGPVDLAIVCVPRRFVLPVIEDLGRKGVSVAHLFTAGFAETGKLEDAQAEHDLVLRARQAGVRIIGPNCMGLYNPHGGMPWGPSTLMGKPGPVGFISQSGGHAVKMAEVGSVTGINYSKMASYGNGADLDSADFLEYLGADKRTKVVGAYIEGCRDGARLAGVLKKVTRTKPVVLFKGGRTRQGAEAASSHTGSMIASGDVWAGVLKQSGAIAVRDLEELADTLLLFQQVRIISGLRMGIICGLTDGGGGESVLAADACGWNGVEVPRFTPATREKMGSIFGEIGGVLRNPLDVSQGYGDLGKLRQALELMCVEPQLDIISIYENVEILVRFLSAEKMGEMNRMFIEFNNRKVKPVISVLPPGSNDLAWLEVRKTLTEAGIPVFNSMDRAARAVANVGQWFSRRVAA